MATDAATFAQIMARLADGAPNIDGWSVNPDDVWSLAEILNGNSRARVAGRVMFPTRPAGYVKATQDLAHYAYNKATAMRCRARGDVGTAQGYEDICERIYKALPDFARW